MTSSPWPPTTQLVRTRLKFFMEIEKISPEDLFADPSPVIAGLQAQSKMEGVPILNKESARALYQLCAIHKPHRVLELGTGLGYSACWLACGMKQGEIHLNDYRAEYLQRARVSLEQVNPAIGVTLFAGEATEVLELVSSPYDLIFIDIDKVYYRKALLKALDKLREGGLLIFDNALFSGRTFAAEPSKQEGVLSIRKTIAALQKMKFITHLWPIGDGLLVTLKDC